MGLAERREIKRLQEEVVPPKEQELQAITGSDIKYDIDWPSFSESLNAMKRFEDNAFDNINEAFRSLCRDPMGKEAVAESIKTIRISNKADNSSFGEVRLTNNTLDIPWDWHGWAGSFYPSSLTESLEKVL